MNPTQSLTKALAKARSKASPYLRARAVWAGLFGLVAVLRAAAAPSPPPRTPEGVAAMLGAAVGGEVRSEDFVWEARGGSWYDAFFGRWVLFLARKPGATSADLYRARVRVTRGGQPLTPSGVRNLTQSPLGDDRDLVAFGHHAAYVTSAFGAVQGVTLLDLAGEGDAREAHTRAERAASAIAGWLDTGSAHGIGRTEVTFGTSPDAVREELQGDRLVMALGRDAVPAAVDVRDGSLDTGPSNAFAAEAQRIPRRAPPLGRVAVRAVRALLGNVAASGLEGVLGAVSRVSSALHPGAHDGGLLPAPAGAPADASAPSEPGWPPPPIAPVATPALAGEGVWTPGRIARAGEAPSCMFETAIRPELEHPDDVVRLWAMDTRQLDLRLAAGVEEPRSEVGLHGSGRAPEGAAEHAVAAFAGGPAASGGDALGFMAERRVLVPPVPGLATVAIAGDGHVGLGAWSREGEATAGFASVRQTPDAILGWKGAPRSPLAGADDRIERSALGLTGPGQLVYAWSARASAGALAHALSLAGCVYAVPLAAAPAPVGLAFLGPSRPAELALPAMSLSLERPGGRSPGELFYAVLRPPPAPAGATFAPDGGKQPSPAWLPAVHKAVVVTLGAQVRLTAFAPGRAVFRIRPGAKEPATKAVAALPAALPEGEQGRVLAAVGLSAGRKRGARGLIVGGAVVLPFRSDDAGALVVDRGRPRIVRANEVPAAPPADVDATELPLTADDGKLRQEARDVGTMRPRAAACTLLDGTFVVASTTFDSDEAATTALLDVGCTRVVALERGAHVAAFVHRAGTDAAPEAHYEATALYVVEAPMAGRAGPLPP